MAEEDVGNAIAILQDLSQFATLADRLQQGLLNFLFLGRLMKHPDGFSSHAAFQIDGAPLLDTGASSTSTATARAPSSAARCARWRRTSVAACSAKRA